MNTKNVEVGRFKFTGFVKIESGKCTLTDDHIRITFDTRSIFGSIFNQVLPDSGIYILNETWAELALTDFNLWMINMNESIIEGTIPGYGYKSYKFQTELGASITHKKWNRSKKKQTTSSFKGVNYNSKSKTWCARISVNSKMIYLGYYKTEIEAYESFCNAVKLYRGGEGI